MSETAWVDDVLRFWFEELTYKDWFGGGAELDEKIRSRFLALYEKLASSVPAAVYESADAALAAVIVFDQFPRNMFRGTAKAFATDPMALAIAGNALDKGFDAGMPNQRRSFLYMPLMHSEALADQRHCVTLFATLDNDEGLKYAKEHRDIVARFGRFPHRNRALGRESTDDEIAFMGGHKGYGQ